MALAGVEVTREVYLACLTHALSTEAEEVVGLLLGSIEPSEAGPVARLRRAVPQIRTDRRKDRVETSAEQMAAASALAEHVAAASGVPTRVVGWYHSHPHITVLPSHVDVNTQAMYQQMDECFVGLIFSVFNASAGTKQQTVQLTAFQALPGRGLGAPSSAELEGLDQQLQAALVASAADAHEAAASGWRRREVPLRVVPGSSSSPSTLADYIEVQRMLLAEEQAAHAQRRAASAEASTGEVHAALLGLQDSAAHSQALLAHAEALLAPALAAMQQLAAQTELQAQQLEADSERLRGLLAQQAGVAAAAAAAGQEAGVPAAAAGGAAEEAGRAEAAAAAAASPLISIDEAPPAGQQQGGSSGGGGGEGAAAAAAGVAGLDLLS